jgi:hypothetical protein
MMYNNKHHESTGGLVKVLFDLHKEGGPFAVETLWAEPVGDSRYRLRNVPF